MVNLGDTVTAFLAVLTFLHPGVNEDLKQNKPVDLIALVKDTVPQAVPFLPGLMQALSPNFHPPGDLPTFPPMTTPPVDGTWVHNSSVPLQYPDEDPFYSPPADSYQGLNNGDIIAIRNVGLPAVFKNVSKAFELSFKSESTSGTPTADVTLVIVPVDYDGETLLSYQSYEDSSSTKCAPSYTMFGKTHNSLLDDFMAAGWALNIPDHEGMGSAFGAGKKSGKATLDSIRAVKNIKDQLGFSFSKLGLYGYSGGSIATGHAIELQPTYAPEIEITTTALGGYVVNVSATFDLINGGLFAGFAPTGVIGLGSEYPGVATELEKYLKPDYKNRFNSVKNNCASGDLVNFIGQDIYSYLVGNNADLLHTDAVQAAFKDTTLGYAKPNTPLFVFQGVQDEIAPVADVDATVDFYCRNGVALEYSRNPDLAHITGALLNNDNVLSFLKRTFSGYVPPQCSSYKAAMVPTQKPTLPELLDALAEYLHL